MPPNPCSYLRKLSELLVRYTLSKNQLLGLTATPGRTLNTIESEQNEDLARKFNRKKITLDIDNYENPVQFLIEKGYMAQPNFESIEGYDKPLTEQEISYLKSGTDTHCKELFFKLGKDANRNVRVINKCKELIENKGHKRIIIFTASVEQSEALALILPNEVFKNVSNPGTVRSITQHTNVFDRQKFIEEYKTSRKDDGVVRILLNYDILTTGFDAPETSAVIVARPTFSIVLYSQMIGRALRGEKVGGNKNADIINVIDSKLTVFKDIEKAFLEWEDLW